MNAKFRRTALFSALIAASFSTAVTTAVLIPTVSAMAQNAEQPATSGEVSPMMQDLVRNFVEKSIYLAAIESLGEAEMVGTVVQERSKALVALAFHQPASLMELAAKLSAISEYSEDTERWSVRILAEDAARLAGRTAQ